MTETDLIRITYNPSQDAIDFGVPTKADKLIVKKDAQIIRMLRRLANCLEKREYPFGNMPDDSGFGSRFPETIEEVELEEMRQLIEDFTDADSCHYDHHGYCQAHNWLRAEPKCPHARAKELLK